MGPLSQRGEVEKQSPGEDDGNATIEGAQALAELEEQQEEDCRRAEFQQSTWPVPARRRGLVGLLRGGKAPRGGGMPQLPETGRKVCLLCQGTWQGPLSILLFRNLTGDKELTMLAGSQAKRARRLSTCSFIVF